MRFEAITDDGRRIPVAVEHLPKGDGITVFKLGGQDGDALFCWPTDKDTEAFNEMLRGMEYDENSSIITHCFVDVSTIPAVGTAKLLVKVGDPGNGYWPTEEDIAQIKDAFVKAGYPAEDVVVIPAVVNVESEPK